MRLAIAATALALGACYSPKLDRCQVTCVDSDHCPGADLCLADGFCHAPDDQQLCNPDARPIDGGVDAEPDATPDAEPDAMPEAIGVNRMTLGAHVGCVIDTETRLWCWGSNRRGAVGISLATPRAVNPVEVGGGTGWTEVSAGIEHVCGIKDAQVYCWGSDDNGESIDANPDELDTPTLRSNAGTGWVAIAAGEGFTCGIRDDAPGRNLYCWGQNDEGQLGKGTAGTVAGTTFAVAAADDGAHDDWTSVQASVDTACAIRDAGEAYCWGRDDEAQIGDGAAADPADRFAPRRVVASPDGGEQLYRKVVPGRQATCGVGTSGALYCWGNNGYNQLARDGNVTEPAPVRVGTDADWTDVSVAYFHACGSRADGVYCWGAGVAGQLGDGSWGYRTPPTRAVGTTTSALVDTGYHETCAAPSTGGVLCWGENADGELGNGETSRQYVPKLISAGGWTDIAAGSEATCGVQDGVAKCWGGNGSGEIDGTVSEGSRVPVAVPGVPATAVEVVSGYFHGCALADDGGGLQPWCWGDNSSGQVGTGTKGGRITPTEVGDPGAWQQLTTGGYNTCALLGTTRVCWGQGSGYGFGNNATDPVDEPTAITDGGTWIAHTMGFQFGCGVQTGGALACWGIDSYGTQGNGAATGNVATPAVIETGISYAKVGARGNNHICAIQADGDATCWGMNSHGQVAQTTGLEHDTPQLVPGVGDWIDISTAYLHSCGIKNAGELYCWGTQEYFQLGIDEVGARSQPVRVGDDTGWDQVSVGGYHVCAIHDGDLWCWGTNFRGQLGDGWGPYNTPQAVVFP